jgi:hypothetical protein
MCEWSFLKWQEAELTLYCLLPIPDSRFPTSASRPQFPIPEFIRKVHAPGGAAGLQTQEGASDASW